MDISSTLLRSKLKNGLFKYSTMLWELPYFIYNYFQFLLKLDLGKNWERFGQAGWRKNFKKFLSKINASFEAVWWNNLNALGWLAVCSTFLAIRPFFPSN